LYLNPRVFGFQFFPTSPAEVDDAGDDVDDDGPTVVSVVLEGIKILVWLGVTTFLAVRLTVVLLLLWNLFGVALVVALIREEN
jgi:hypothetical protein